MALQRRNTYFVCRDVKTADDPDDVGAQDGGSDDVRIRSNILCQPIQAGKIVVKVEYKSS